MTTYEEYVDAVVSAVETQLKTVIEFDDRVYKGFFHEINTYPSCLYMLIKDTPDRAAMKERHHLFFDILVFYRGGDNTPDEDLDGLTAITGKVWDALIAKVTNSPTWETLRFEDVDYIYNRDKSLIFYITLIKIRISKRWG